MRAAEGRDPGNDHAGWLLPEPCMGWRHPILMLMGVSEHMTGKHLELFDNQFFFFFFNEPIHKETPITLEILFLL